jgi:predicted permease
MAGLFLAGLVIQRWRQASRMRDGMWWTSYNLLAPLVSFAGFASVTLDGPLLGALLAVVISSWLVLALSRTYARYVGPDPAERGAVALAGAFGNTSFLGLPVAGLFFGDAGVVLMALYAQLRWILPEIAVTVATAEAYGEPGRARPLRSLARYVVNPPTIAALLTIALRLSGVDMVEQGLFVGRLMAQVVGPFGFLLLGLSLPLDPWSGSRLSLRDLGALVIRHALSPLCLLVVAAVLRVHLPAVFIFGSAMPCAFNLVVIARMFEVDASKTRGLVLISTALALAVILVASFAR